MNTNEKYEIADLVIKHALKNGANQIAVSIDDSTSRRIEIREKKIDRLQESIGNTLTVSLYVDNKYSSNTTNLLKKDDLLKFVKGTVASTRYLSEDEFRYLPDKELYYQGGRGDLKTIDLSINDVDPKTKIDLAREVENEIYGTDDRIVSVTSSYEDNISNSVLVASNGFKGDSGVSYASLVAIVSLKGDTGRPEAYAYDYNIFFDKLIKSGLGKTALDKAIKKLNPKKISSGKYQMVIDKLVAPNIIRPFISALNGSSMYQKNSFLTAKTNKKVASEKLSFIDDPLLLSRFGSRHFDSEGLNAVKRNIIEDGILRNYYIGTYYGRKLDLPPTTASSSNIIYKQGDKDLNGLIKSIKKGILVTGFNGGNCNGATGDFSYGIEGFFVENGEIIHPVNEMNISGNMNDFWNTLVETGNDPNPYDSNMIPSLLFDKTDFSGL
ncbi:MAG TPA: TldD/PmbA family protein [Bacteroidales bacterium]|nr:TldD/PmbA family protein [Bacteroidales bacterium]